MVDKQLFSKNSDEWKTPQDLYDELSGEFDFHVDPCASESCIKGGSFKPQFNITKHNMYVRTHEGFIVGGPGDGLKQDWWVHGCLAGNVFVNPPYSEYPKWVKKAQQESLKGCTVVVLIAARTETVVWQDIIFPHADEIRFIKGRVKFIDADGNTGPAPFPSAIVIFRPPFEGRYKYSRWRR